MSPFEGAPLDARAAAAVREALTADPDLGRELDSIADRLGEAELARFGRAFAAVCLSGGAVEAVLPALVAALAGAGAGGPGPGLEGRGRRGGASPDRGEK